MRRSSFPRLVLYIVAAGMFSSNAPASRAASVASRSNPVDDDQIVIDGSFADWAGTQPYPDDDAGDAPPGDQDWLRVCIAHDTTNVYLRLERAAGSTGFRSPIVSGGTTGGLGYWVILDTDGNANTGLKAAGGRTFSIGGEYNFGGALALNRWSVTGSWLGDVPFIAASSDRQLEIAVARSAVGNPSSFRFVLVGETSGDYHPAQGNTSDYFEYELNPPPPAPTGEVAVRSNQVAQGAIVIDGQLDDWDEVIPYPADRAGDGTGGQDWLQVWMAHDENHFYLRYRRTPDSVPFTSPGYWGLFDIDRGPDTGLLGFGPRSFAIGAELNTSGNDTLNRWSARSCHLSSTGLSSAISPDGLDLEMAIPRAEFGPRSRFHLVFVGENSGDYYPEGGNGGAYFSYSLYPTHVPFADADGDGDVDPLDLLAFTECITGPSEPLEPAQRPACARFDRDDDLDVDQEDFGRFQICLTGSDVPAEPDCDRPATSPAADPIEHFVVLPEQKRPYPQPLPPGVEPGFRIRGTKGWNWTPEQYLAEVPVLARLKMNFLMNCYLSIYTVQGGNRWWTPLPDSARIAYEQVIAECQKYGVNFCFCMNPQLFSPDPLDPTSDADFQLLWQHYHWAQTRGVKWFCIALDDISGVPIIGEQHAQLCNRMLARLRATDPQAQLIFCPTWYWGNGSEGRSYLEALGATLHGDVYLFWTGDSVVPLQITTAAAAAYKAVVNHRLVLWENYPVNDGASTLHLGPLVGRDPALSELIDGYMSNPMYPQNESNRLPLSTIADFAYNPVAYDPVRSIGQAIAHLADTPEQQLVLRDLVEAYPGMMLYECGEFGTGYNPVRQRFTRIASRSPAQQAAYIQHIESIALRLESLFPGQFQATRATILADVAWMVQNQP